MLTPRTVLARRSSVLGLVALGMAALAGCSGSDTAATTTSTIEVRIDPVAICQDTLYFYAAAISDAYFGVGESEDSIRQEMNDLYGWKSNAYIEARMIATNTAGTRSGYGVVAAQSKMLAAALERCSTSSDLRIALSGA